MWTAQRHLPDGCALARSRSTTRSSTTPRSSCRWAAPGPAPASATATCTCTPTGRGGPGCWEGCSSCSTDAAQTDRTVAVTRTALNWVLEREKTTMSSTTADVDLSSVDLADPSLWDDGPPYELFAR